MIIYWVHYEIRVILPLLIKQLKEDGQTLLPKVVPKQLDRHEVMVQSKCLCDLKQSKVVDFVISHVKMNQTLICMDCLSDRFCSVVRALVASEMQGFESAVLVLKILGQCLATLKRDVV
jgi:hypothetical protein